MRMTRKTALIVAGALCLLFTALSSHAGQVEDNIEKILEGTGLNKLIDHAPNIAMSALKQSAFAMDDPEINSQLNGAFQKSFTSEKIKQNVTTLLHHDYDESLSTAYLAMQREPLWIKMAELERASSDPANRQSMINFAEDIKQHPSSDTRIQLIKQLDKANRASKFSVDLQVAIFKSVFTAINPALDTEMKIDNEEMDKMGEEVRLSMEKDIENHVTLSYLFSFRELSDDELASYVELCESETNRTMNQQLTGAVISAINQAANRAADEMIKRYSH